MASPYGVCWEAGLSYNRPRWVAEPSLQAIANLTSEALRLPLDKMLSLKPLGQGSCNKVYKVETTVGSYVFRVAMPLDPLKVQSEVATVDWVRRNTNIPVPAIIACDRTGRNELRYPWILMEIAPGQPLDKVWRHKLMAKKTDIVKQLAAYEAQLLAREFDKLGSLSYARAKSECPKKYRWAAETYLTTILSVILLPISLILAIFAIFYPRSSSRVGKLLPDFIITRRVHHEYLLEPTMEDFTLRFPSGSSPGPHLNSYASMKYRLEQCICKTEAEMKQNEDPDELEDLEVVIPCAETILSHLPRIFAPHEQERATLFHHDLHAGNIFIDDKNKISAILDWEFTSTRPSYATHTFPKLLQGERRLNKPHPGYYSHPPPGGDDVDEEGKANRKGLPGAYWEALEEYQNTILRDVYADELERLCQGWKEEYKVTGFHRVLDCQVGVLEFGSGIRDPSEWLEAWDGKRLIGYNQRWPRLAEDYPCALEDEELGPLLDTSYRLPGWESWKEDEDT